MAQTGIDRLRALTAQLNRYRYEYYSLNAPTVSDEVYDRLFDELGQLERELGVQLGNSPTQTVGWLAVDKLKKAHKFSKQELNWITRMEKYLMEESVLNVTVFDEDGRFKAQGGFAKINKVFGNKLESIILELNEYLYDDGGKIA